MQTLTLTRPDDWHVHLRDGAMLATVLPYTARQFARAIVMPNLTPPVLTTDQAIQYRWRIMEALPQGVEFTPLMTAYLSDHTDPSDLAHGFETGVFTAAKLYPAHATTNSAHGVTDVGQIHTVLERMQRIGMPLLIHGEVTDPAVDIFDREAAFIERVLTGLVADFPALRIVLEHCTTHDAVEFVQATPGIAATITAHHLMINRNALFAGGLQPHAYCLPIAKREKHRLALRQAATSGDPSFFLGTDTAPHTAHAKESGCGCAGAQHRQQGEILRLRRHLHRAQRPGSLRAGVRRGSRAGQVRSLRQPQRPALVRAAGEYRDGDAEQDRLDRARSHQGGRYGRYAAPFHGGRDDALADYGAWLMYSYAFTDPAVKARMTAKALLDIDAVLFNAETPFIFTSGWASPVYIDCRKVIGFPRVRSMLCDFAVSTIAAGAPFGAIDSVAGGETAGIPYAAWISERMGLPMQYVRKKPKGFGRNAQIEGEVVEGARTLLVEDLATDGRSKVNFCKALRDAGADVDHCFVLFYYDIFPDSADLMREIGIKLHYLTTWWDVLAVAKEMGTFDPATLAEVESFLHEPARWSAAHCGIASFGQA